VPRWLVLEFRRDRKKDALLEHSAYESAARLFRFLTNSPLDEFFSSPTRIDRRESSHSERVSYIAEPPPPKSFAFERRGTRVLANLAC